MQNNVNAENVLQSIVRNFGDRAVSTCDGGIIKLQVKELRNGDVLTLSCILQWSDVQVKRSDKGLLILLIPKPWEGPYSDELLKQIDSIEGDTEQGKPSETSIEPRTKQEDFEIAVEPLIELMRGYHPHHSAIVTSTHAELLEGQMVVSKDI